MQWTDILKHNYALFSFYTFTHISACPIVFCHSYMRLVDTNKRAMGTIFIALAH